MLDLSNRGCNKHKPKLKYDIGSTHVQLLSTQGKLTPEHRHGHSHGRSHDHIDGHSHDGDRDGAGQGDCH
jgi:hypothetical protein